MVSVILYPCMWICLSCVLRVCELFVKQFAICLGVVIILLLNVMKLFSVGGGALLDRPWMVFQMLSLCCFFV